jgi:PAB-dependent poly(A)-specific ribonuclease subunit 3
MEMVHMQPASTKNGLVRNSCTEEQLWSYLVQISSALRALHTNGLVARTGNLMPNKVLLTSAGRVRLGSLGILDTLSDNSNMDLHRMQREDLTVLPPPPQVIM